MKLKYIAIVNNVVAIESRPEQFYRNLTTAMERRKDKKGKGKASVDSFSSMVEDFEDSGSDIVENALVDVVFGVSKLRIPTYFAAADDVKIFSKQIRFGRLLVCDKLLVNTT
jgi:hypothetical protein